MECGPTNVTVTASPTGPVSIGTDLTLQCLAEDPTGSGLTYQWLKNGTLISGELSPTFMVTVMGPQVGGIYTCRVSNRVGQGEASVTVEVIGEWLVLMLPWLQEYSGGVSALECALYKHAAKSECLNLCIALT